MYYNEKQLKAMCTAARDQCWARLRNNLKDVVRLSEGGFNASQEDLELVEMIASLLVSEIYFQDAQFIEDLGVEPDEEAP